MRSDKFGSQLNRKSKTWFFTFLHVYTSRIDRDKILISQLSLPNFRYFADQNGPKGWPHENEFWHFPNTKMNITNSYSSKSRLKTGVICLVFFFPSSVMVCKLPKIVHFRKFVMTSPRNPSLSKQSIYIDLKDPIIFFQKVVCFIRVWATIYKISRKKISEKVLTQQKFNEIHQLQTLISSKL